MSSSVDSTVIAARRPVIESPAAPVAPADLRAALRKTSHPPSFIRPNERPPHEKSPSPSPFSSSVPWRTSKLASSAGTTTTTTAAAAPVVNKKENIKTEDLTARIEALTAMANQTVAKVDRITAAETATPTNGAPQPAASTGVRAVASKLLSRATESPPKQPGPLPASHRPGKLDVLGVVNSAKLLPQQEQIASATSPVKNRAADKPLPTTPFLAAELKHTSSATGQNKPPASEMAPLPGAAPATALPVAQSTTAQPLEKVALSDETATSSVKTVQGILKKKVEGSPDAVHPIVRIRPVVETAAADANDEVSEPPVSILKRRSSREEVEPEATNQSLALDPSTLEPHHSILKRPPSRDGSAESSRSLSPDPLNSILKRPPSSASSTQAATPSNLPTESNPADPRPILKKRSSTEDILNDPRPILKKKSSTDDEHEPSPSDSRPKPILKSGRRSSSEQLDLEESSLPLRPPRRPVEFREAAVPEGSPEETNPAEPTQLRPLSVAERIEAHKQNALAAASSVPPVPAPRRLAPRLNGANDSPTGGAVANRRYVVSCFSS